MPKGKGQSYSQQVNAGTRQLRDADDKKKPGKRNVDVFENTPPSVGAGSKSGKGKKA